MPTRILTLEELKRTAPPVNEVEAALRDMWRRIRPHKRTGTDVLRRLQRACVRIGSVEALKDVATADLPTVLRGGGQVVLRLLLTGPTESHHGGAPGPRLQTCART